MTKEFVKNLGCFCKLTKTKNAEKYRNVWTLVYYKVHRQSLLLVLLPQMFIQCIFLLDNGDIVYVWSGQKQRSGQEERLLGSHSWPVAAQQHIVHHHHSLLPPCAV
jgi:hypothetical protein